MQSHLIINHLITTDKRNHLQISVFLWHDLIRRKNASNRQRVALWKSASRESQYWLSVYTLREEFSPSSAILAHAVLIMRDFVLRDFVPRGFKPALFWPRYYGSAILSRAILGSHRIIDLTIR